MARTRNIKPGFFDNDTLGSLAPIVRLLFIGLWCIADREGRLEDRPRRIKKTLLGYDDVTADETSGMLQQLADNGFIIRYRVGDTDYIQVTNFLKHQNPNLKEKESEIPPPPPHAGHTETPREHESGGGNDEGSSESDEDPLPDPDDESSGDQATPEPEEKPESSAEHIDLAEIRFAAFWDAYPKKRAKKTALRAWKKLNPDAELFDKIMAAVERQKQSVDWMKENGQYIPYPATWLNGGCWDDIMSGDTVAPGTSFATDDFWNACLARSYGTDTIGGENQ